MIKNILVITGSPRKHGNSDMMAEAFIKGAKEAGHIVNKYGAAFSKINETDINPPAELGRLTDASSDKQSTRIKTPVV